MTARAKVPSDAEILVLLNAQHQNGPLWHKVDPLQRRLCDAAYAAGAASETARLLTVIERMRVAALMSDWDDFNAAINDAAPAARAFLEGAK